jgi:hypothetical protein
MSLMKYIFVDMDECLLHARLITSGIGNNTAKLARITEREKNYGPVFTCGSEVYATRLRPGALDLLKRLRSDYGKENVRMLTAAVNEYAQRNNEVLGLGFLSEQILSREHINQTITHNILKKVATTERGYVALIDNLHPMDNRSKLDYLRPLVIPTKFVAYVKVQEYYGLKDDPEFSQETINEIINTIERKFAGDQH